VKKVLFAAVIYGLITPTKAQNLYVTTGPLVACGSDNQLAIQAILSGDISGLSVPPINPTVPGCLAYPIGTRLVIQLDGTMITKLMVSPEGKVDWKYTYTRWLKNQSSNASLTR